MFFLLIIQYVQYVHCTVYMVKENKCLIKEMLGQGYVFRQNLIIFPYCAYYASVTGKGKDIYYINTINIKLH